MNFIKQTTKNIIKITNIIFINFTLAKFLGAVFTITIISSLKYCISGSFHIEYCDFWNNIGIGLLGWTINNGTISWFTEYLGLKGLNFNLYQFLYGFHTMNANDGSKVADIKLKSYCAMETDKELNKSLDKGKDIDKGKGIDRSNFEGQAQSEGNASWSEGYGGNSLDKGKGVDRTVHPNYDRNSGNVPSSIEPPYSAWSRVFHPAGVDTASVFSPKKINPGPGFNVPGGEVPIRDEICKHIDYNSHILSQFKKMDLETAIQQINNNLALIKVLQEKLDFASNALSNVPTIPTTQYEFRLKNQILRDLNELNINKTRAEARVTLLNSRIEFIELKRSQS